MVFPRCTPYRRTVVDKKGRGMGVTIFAFLMLFLLIIGSVISFIASRVHKKPVKFILWLIMLLVTGIPVSWFALGIYSAILTAMEDIIPVFIRNHTMLICSYFVVVNVLGVAGYLLYTYIRKKNSPRHIRVNEYVAFLLRLIVISVK